jgi:hypothetical protein
MKIDRPSGQLQFVRDRCRCQAIGNEGENLNLALAEAYSGIASAAAGVEASINDQNQSIEIDRLGDVIVRTEPACLEFIVPVRHAGDKYKGNLRGVHGDSIQPLQDLETAH